MRKKIISLLLVFLFIFTLMPITYVNAKSKVKLNKTYITIQAKKSYTLKLAGTKKKIKWYTSNKKIATVSPKGKVKAKKSGKSTITAKIGKKKYRCKVVVQSYSKIVNTFEKGGANNYKMYIYLVDIVDELANYDKYYTKNEINTIKNNIKKVSNLNKKNKNYNKYISSLVDKKFAKGKKAWGNLYKQSNYLNKLIYPFIKKPLKKVNYTKQYNKFSNYLWEYDDIYTSY